ncbi:hypothetical protein FS763_23730 [Agrobacterium vitis]|nr:hypothetical protein [Allorhizobium ampelinum]MCF1474922.1 hypothetical protein [Allorhizobium ampelinum]MVA73512.1 hypothetical protein [Agrobacterium vitis]
MDDLAPTKEHIGRHCEFARGIALQPEWGNITSPISVLSNSGGSSRLRINQAVSILKSRWTQLQEETTMRSWKKT